MPKRIYFDSWRECKGCGKTVDPIKRNPYCTPECRKQTKPHFIRKKITPSNEFFNSPRWLKARWDALKRHGFACMACGRSKKLHGVVIQVDHIKPRSKYPHLELDPNNLQVLCQQCNMGKSNRTEDDLR